MSNCLSSPVRFVDLLHVDNIIQLSSVSDSLPARRREKVFSSDKRFTKSFLSSLVVPFVYLVRCTRTSVQLEPTDNSKSNLTLLIFKGLSKEAFVYVSIYLRLTGFATPMNCKAFAI